MRAFRLKPLITLALQVVRSVIRSHMSILLFLLTKLPEHSPGVSRTEDIFGDVVSFLARALPKGALRWRQAFMAQVLMTYMLPFTRSEELMKELVHGHFEAALDHQSLLGMVLVPRNALLVRADSKRVVVCSFHCHSSCVRTTNNLQKEQHGQ